MQNSYCLLGVVSPSFLNLSLMPISYFPFLHDLHPSPAALHHYGPLWKSSTAIKPPPQAPDSSSVYSLCTSKENHCNRWLYWVWSFIVAIDGFKAQNICHIFWQLPWDCIGCFCLTNPDKVVNVFPAQNLHQWGCKSGSFCQTLVWKLWLCKSRTNLCSQPTSQKGSVQRKNIIETLVHVNLSISLPYTMVKSD